MKHSLNRLQHETSQYLKSHAGNPVDWYPWGNEALQKSKRENKPIFLSIGYSACHWCHVMEKESFENVQTAEMMNAHFINIKVDREERQDLDHIYMTAVQLLTGRGGWPMSVFLTPDLKPFYGGTYFPPEDRHGLPGFKKLLLGIANAWANKPAEVLNSSEHLFLSLSQIQQNPEGASQSIDPHLFEESVKNILPNFDERFGGFSGAPKFFHTMDMQVALLYSARTKDKKIEALLKKTWQAWADGGIYDHLAGGFHRYSTDEEWFAPHFEKMLYDNALVISTYLEGYKLYKEPLYSQIASQTLDYILREMTSPEGAFFSTEDADSEGVEGKFYVWTKEEISLVLGSEIADVFCKVYQVTKEGNWEYSNILHLRKTIKEYAQELNIDTFELEDTLSLARRKLLLERTKRPRPRKDEKIITSWNAMMIDTLAKASQILSNEKYLEASQNAAAFARLKLKNPGELLHSYQDGKAILKAYLDDWANLCNAFTTLFEVSGDELWLKEALELCQGMITNFYDEKTGDFYFTAKNHETLLFRPKEFYDGATPSATSIAITAMARLGRITSDPKLLKIVEKVVLTYQEQIKKIPSAHAQMLLAAEYTLPSCKEIVLYPGEDPEEQKAVLHFIHENYLGCHVCIFPTSLLKNSPLLKGKKSIDGKTTLYLCQNQSCAEPLIGLGRITERLAELVKY